VAGKSFRLREFDFGLSAGVDISFKASDATYSACRGRDGLSPMSTRAESTKLTFKRVVANTNFFCRILTLERAPQTVNTSILLWHCSIALTLRIVGDEVQGSGVEVHLHEAVTKKN
jgi:hypothetical protein